MSMIIGYGICLHDIPMEDLHPANFWEVLALVPKMQKRAEEALLEDYPADEETLNKITLGELITAASTEFGDDDPDEMEVAGFLAEIAKERYDINLTFCEDAEFCYGYLLFEPAFPWDIWTMDKDKWANLTEEELRRLFAEMVSKITKSPRPMEGFGLYAIDTPNY